MPTYEYKCEECGITFDCYQHFSDDPLELCPECEGSVHRVIHPVGVIFKGSGFYVTDNRNKKADRAARSEKSESSDADAKPEAAAKSTENKSSSEEAD